MPITEEQPPESTAYELSEYLLRMFRQAKSEDSNSSLMPIYQNLPAKPEKGKIYYFDRIINPEITSIGYWGFTTLWVKLA